MNEQIQELISSVDRYNPSNIHLLQSHLDAQLSSGNTLHYDLAANLALLKLYQFNQQLLDTTATIQIIFLAIINNPFGADHLLVKALLADTFVAGAKLPSREEREGENGEEEVRESEGEKQIVERLSLLSDALQARRFTTFWKLLNQKSSTSTSEIDQKVIAAIDQLKAQSNEWKSIIQNQILHQIQGTFVVIKASIVESYLGLLPNSSELDQVLARFANGVTRVDNLIKFAQTESNTPKAVLQREKINIDQLSKLLATSQVA